MTRLAGTLHKRWYHVAVIFVLLVGYPNDMKAARIATSASMNRVRSLLQNTGTAVCVGLIALAANWIHLSGQNGNSELRAETSADRVGYSDHLCFWNNSRMRARNP